VRLEEVKRADKKPTEGQLEDICNLNELVRGEEEAFDKAEVEVEKLKNYLSVFSEAHVYFRQMSKSTG
jgi:hypothetical protein